MLILFLHGKIGTSSYLREHSHGKDMSYIIKTAVEVIEYVLCGRFDSNAHHFSRYVKSQGKEIRFSSEDSFRSDLVDLLSIYSAVDKVGVTRVSYLIPPALSLVSKQAL